MKNGNSVSLARSGPSLSPERAEDHPFRGGNGPTPACTGRRPSGDIHVTRQRQKIPGMLNKGRDPVRLDLLS